MVEAIIKEIGLTPAMDSSTAFEKGKEACETIYFGGGTPSVLSADDILLLRDALSARFIVAGDAEITLEANPDDITPGKLQQWRQAGINRLSVGIQSFKDAELQWMNRAHNAAASLRCIDEINDAGFTNYSVDLIYGSPLLSNKDWQENVMTVIEKKIPHISCYALTVEPRTALESLIAHNKKAPVDPATQAEQFMLLMNWMEQYGYEQYEISNFALPGMRSRHNSSYWQGKNYYGFGPSAHAYDGKKRRWNVANNSLYIQSLQQNQLPFEEELLTTTQRLNEYIMTALRTSEGMDLDMITTNFGIKYSSDIKAMSSKYTGTNKLQQINSRLVLTREGKLFADGIAADLFI